MTVARVLPHCTGTGADQMARDAALLEWVAAHPERLALRTYSWSRPTLSLGRAEPFPGDWDREAIERSGLDVVRRPTGGDAVLHIHEITFAVAASLPGALRVSPAGFVGRVAEGIVAAIRDQGLPAARIERNEAAPPSPPGRHPCFGRPARNEVRVGPFKVAGIAARLTRGGVLAHGSIPRDGRFREIAALRARDDSHRLLLARARGLEELLGAPIDEARFRERLITRLAEAFEAEAVREELEPRGAGSAA